MELCINCYGQGFCRRLSARLVTDAELSNPAFVCDLRSHAARMNISPDHWARFLVDTYRDYPGVILNTDRREVSLDLEVFDDPNIRYWFRDTACVPCEPGITPRVRIEARERFRLMATLLRAIDPVAGAFWGVRAANDGPAPQLRPLTAFEKSCPYPRLLYSRKWRRNPVRVKRPSESLTNQSDDDTIGSNT